MNKGILIVVAAPSAGGKGTILAEYRKTHDFYYSISNTTRSPRVGEVDGVHYHFIGREEFEEKIKSGDMLEHASYCDNYYGTPRVEVEEKLNAGMDVVLEIEYEGAMQVQKSYPDALLIFIAPPNMEVLRERLTRRGTEDEATIEKRLKRAVFEIDHAYQYDYIVINDSLEEAVMEFTTIVSAKRYSAEIRREFMKEVYHYDA